MNIIDSGVFLRVEKVEKVEKCEIMFWKDDFTKTEAEEIFPQIEQAWGMNTSLMHLRDVSGLILVCTEEHGSHYVSIGRFALVELPKDKTGNKIKTDDETKIAHFYEFGVRNINPGIPL